MAQGCISVIEMTVSACLVQEHSHLRVMAKGKKLPRFDVSKAGQGFVAVGALCHATFLSVGCWLGISGPLGYAQASPLGESHGRS